MLERYGYQIETTDENGDIILTENLCDADTGRRTTHPAPPLLSLTREFLALPEQNDNARRVVQEAQMQREKAKEKHQQKTAREKELLLREQEKKEKRKRRTEKREKRRL